MNKESEKRCLVALLHHLHSYEIIEEIEKPDFIIRNIKDGRIIGVEVTQYYPHQDQKNRSIVKKEGSISDEGKLLLFAKTELGYSRFVPLIDINDFQAKVIQQKEGKLERLYRIHHPECSEFWLLVELSFYDNIQYDELEVQTKFDRLFFLEEPNRITEIRKT